MVLPLKPGFHIIAPGATVATVANKMERRKRFLGFRIIATIAHVATVANATVSI